MSQNSIRAFIIIELIFNYKKIAFYLKSEKKSIILMYLLLPESQLLNNIKSTQRDSYHLMYVIV